MPSGKERKAMQDNLHTHHSNMKTGKSGTGNKVKSVSPNKAVNNANPNNAAHFADHKIVGARVGGRADLTMLTSPNDTARANKGVFSVGGEQRGSPSVPRTTKFFVGPKYTSTDSTTAASGILKRDRK